MKLYLIPFLLLFLQVMSALAQDSLQKPQFSNSSQEMLSMPNRLTIGGYGQVDYTKKLEKENFTNASLDVHRLVMLFGYKFDSRTSFVTELEFEHVTELYVEQAFLDYKLSKSITLRTGLLLVPMGFINEYHEPTSFNGVQRPVTDNIIVPTTWREIGAGVTGNLLNAGINYQFYLLNGFNGYDGEASLNGSSGFRGGRQKAARSFMSSPNLSGKIQYYGLAKLNLALSSYYGKSQSTLYQGLNKDNQEAIQRADSSVVNTLWTGFEAFYQNSGIDVRYQLYHVRINNSEEYNQFTGSDLGSAMVGYYIEAGYNILREVKSTSQKVKPFIRYEKVNTHFKTEESSLKNDAYNRSYITAGIGWWMTNGAALKADLQFGRNKELDNYSKTLNIGMGVRF